MEVSGDVIGRFRAPFPVAGASIETLSVAVDANHRRDALWPTVGFRQARKPRRGVKDLDLAALDAATFVIELTGLVERFGVRFNLLDRLKKGRLITFHLGDHLTALVKGDIEGFFWQCSASRV